MTIYNRPDNSIFASGAKQEETGTFPDIERGWGVTESTNFIPPLEYFNAVQNRTDKAIAYLLQRGVAEWSEDIEYPQQAITIKNGQVFFAKQQNTNKDPLFNPEFWVNSFGQKANQSDFDALKNAMIGIPLPYPLETVPENHLAMNGQRFNTRTYSKLAKKYPNGQLPDMRGLVVRGCDNGRGYDDRRTLLSEQGDAIRNITGSASSGGDAVWNGFPRFNKYQGAFSSTYIGEGKWEPDSPNTPIEARTGYRGFYFDASKVVPTAYENRMKNIAFQYICLAR